MFTFEELKGVISGLEYQEVQVRDTQGAIIPKDRIVEVARALKEKYGFLQIIDVIGVDRNERKERFEVTYNLRNHKTFERVFIKVRCDERNPHVPSLSSVWTGCNWMEREAYDMYGIHFDGHPDLRRMYLPDEFKYWPLRKDFPLMGIPGSIPLPNREGSDPRFHIMENSEDLA